MAPFYRWGSAVSRIQSHYEETVCFLSFSSQEFLVLNWSTLEECVELGATQWYWALDPWIGNKHLDH